MLNTSALPENIQCIHKNTDFGFEIYSQKNKNSLLLFTKGLDRFEQQVSEKNEAYKKIELFICLPEYWNLTQDSWPVNYLNLIAQIPQKNETWLGLGDTIPAGNPIQKISEKMDMNHFILAAPKLYENGLGELAEVNFLAVVPIFQTELDFKLRNSATILFSKFEKAGITEMVDQYRKSVCRRRILGLI